MPTGGGGEGDGRVQKRNRWRKKVEKKEGECGGGKRWTRRKRSVVEDDGVWMAG